MASKFKKFKNWVKAHKKAIAVTAGFILVGTAIIVATVLTGGAAGAAAAGVFALGSASLAGGVAIGGLCVAVGVATGVVTLNDNIKQKFMKTVFPYRKTEKDWAKEKQDEQKMIEAIEKSYEQDKKERTLELDEKENLEELKRMGVTMVDETTQQADLQNEQRAQPSPQLDTSLLDSGKVPDVKKDSTPPQMLSQKKESKKSKIGIPKSIKKLAKKVQHKSQGPEQR